MTRFLRGWVPRNYQYSMDNVQMHFVQGADYSMDDA